VKKLTTEEFIEKAKIIHGDRYSYDECQYLNANSKIIIKCPIHGNFEQRASAHIGNQKQGCSKCAGEYRRLTLEFILQKAKKIHWDKYDYSLVVENKAVGEKIKVICKKHGPFKISLDHHLNRGQGCSKCKSLNLDGFIEKANLVHNNKYDYSKSIYINNKCKVDIICPTHGKFNQRVTDHINGKHGCPECTMETLRMTTDEFINKAKLVHGDKFIYDKVKINFKSNKDYIPIICPIHGTFKQRVNSHLSGNGCPICNEPKGEINVKYYLNKSNINFIQQHKFADCKNINPLPFDFYLPDYNTCIEFNGTQHYRPVKWFGGPNAFNQQIKRDKIKMEYCQNKNIPLIIIKYDENIEKVLNSFFNRISIIP
jgi:hypothetical protein